jgi:hypothetical protein
MMEFSPRPWRRGIGNDCHTVFDGQGSIVADRVGTTDGNLIAAAPDLLDALEQAIDDMGGEGHCVCETVKQQMQAAIAKARGSFAHQGG